MKVDGALRIPGLCDGLAIPAEGAPGLLDWLGAVRRRAADRLRREVASDRERAARWLLGSVGALPAMRDEFADEPILVDRVILAIQQVYLTLLLAGGVPVFSKPAEGEDGFWGGEVVEVTTLWGQISDFLREAEMGFSPALHDGEITASRDTTAQWAIEVNANHFRLVEKFTLDHYGDPILRDAERIAFGLSAADVISPLRHPDALRKYTRVAQIPGACIVDLTGLPPELADAIMRFTLTRRRLSQQLAPDLLNDPSAPIVRSTPEALEQSAAFDWLRYAPVMLGMHDGGPQAIISDMLVERCQSKAATGVARRLVVAEQRARALGPQARADAVAALARRFHAHREADAAELMAQLGMTTLHAVETIGAGRLPCGEIDVVGHAAGAHPVVLVCEVKDTDLAFFKDRGPKEAHAVAVKAHKQAERKARWAAEHLPELRVELDIADAAPSQDTVVVALTVPRLTPMPLADHAAASVALVELKTTVAALLEQPPNRWRPDLRRAIVAHEPAIAGA